MVDYGGYHEAVAPVLNTVTFEAAGLYPVRIVYYNSWCYNWSGGAILRWYSSIPSSRPDQAPPSCSGIVPWSDMYTDSYLQPNTPPVANAGPNVKVMIPNMLTLAGTISDDGLPNPPGITTVTWTKTSGPGLVAFVNPNAASTTVFFSTAGTYVLQLTASDSALSGMSNVTVTVLAPGDFNGDGRVDGVDFLIWQAHYPDNPGIAYQCGGLDYRPPVEFNRPPSCRDGPVLCRERLGLWPRWL